MPSRWKPKTSDIGPHSGKVVCVLEGVAFRPSHGVCSIKGNIMAAKMTKIHVDAAVLLEDIVPFLSIRSGDNLMSNVTIRGALEPKEEWSNGIFHNARYFIFMVRPLGSRYFEESDTNVCVELISSGGMNMPKFRKYSGPIAKVLEKVKKWIESAKS